MKSLNFDHDKKGRDKKPLVQEIYNTRIKRKKTGVSCPVIIEENGYVCKRLGRKEKIKMIARQLKQEVKNCGKVKSGKV